jgi:KUP system potassium uptake protein
MSESHGHQPSGGTVALSLGALGVVFGDIGTSPLYALKETFHGDKLAEDAINVLGVASTAFWALIVVISLKYLAFVMRADHHGEGGILALTSLILDRGRPREGGSRWILVIMGLFGTALLYGDGIITPAISVLSAVELLGETAPSIKQNDLIIPISMVILVSLFLVQRKGTEVIGKFFGPIMLVWFAVLGVLGITNIADHPDVLKAVNPKYMVDFFRHGGTDSFLALGSIFLVVTGGEALYADMGHFGRKAIRNAWLAIALPGLVLCYFGQAAVLTNNPKAFKNPLFFMAPSWSTWPLSILAILATIIASQALISGVFSLTLQAVRLDYLPRLTIQHTSPNQVGQVYVPIANWLLMIACLACVLAFQSSTALAAAYGIAVTSTMIVTTILMWWITRNNWHWPVWKSAVVISPLVAIDAAFLGANVPKIPHGGWFPLAVGIAQFTLMVTWHKGRELVASRIQRGETKLDDFLTQIEMAPPKRVSGTAIFLFKGTGAVPPALVMNLRHNKVLHKNVIILNVDVADRPRVDEADRVQVDALGYGLFAAELHFGYLEEPDVHNKLGLLVHPQLVIDPDDLTYFLGHETVKASDERGMAWWREELFALQSRTATSAARFFELPSANVVEVGAHVEI